MKKIESCLGILLILLYILILILYLLKWDIFYLYILIISTTLLATVDSLLRLRQELQEKVGQDRRDHCYKKVTVALLVLVAGLVTSYFTAIQSPSPFGFYRSPDGRHELTVLKYSNFGVAYSARPSMYHILYKDQPKDIVVAPFGRPASDIQVRWLDDGSARVYIIYDPAVGPVEQDSILVSFR